MAGDSIESWIGGEVVFKIDEDRYEAHGILRGLSESGLTARVYISMPSGPYNDQGEPQGDRRLVSVFYPWHRVQEVRFAEDDEKRMPNEAEAP